MSAQDGDNARIDVSGVKASADRPAWIASTEHEVTPYGRSYRFSDLFSSYLRHVIGSAGRRGQAVSMESPR